MESKKQRVKEYSNEDLTVIWKPDVCILAKICWKGLLHVFNPQNRPWINMKGASSQLLKKQVEACPSGALSIKNKTNSNTNTTKTMEDHKTKISLAENGPLFVHGTCEITKLDGTIESKETRTAFCRCGASENKPYCDGKHRKIDFVG